MTQSFVDIFLCG